MANTSMKILSSKNCPATNFRFSTVDANTIEMADGLDARLNKVESGFDALEARYKSLKNQVDIAAKNGRKKLDKKKLSNLQTLSTRISNRIKSCEAANKDMSKWAKQDTQALRDAAKAEAWNKTIDSLLTEESISESTKAALAELKGLL